MAMTLRLDPHVEAELRLAAEEDHRSVHQTVVLAVPSWAKLVRTRSAVDAVEGFAEVTGQGVGGGDGVGAGLDLDGSVAAGSADEFPD
jgi:hypothetical protein